MHDYRLEINDLLFDKEGHQINSSSREGYLSTSELKNLISYLSREKQSSMSLEISNGEIEQAHLYCLRYAQDGSSNTRIRHIYKNRKEA